MAGIVIDVKYYICNYSENYLNMLRLLLLSDIHLLSMATEMDPHYCMRRAFLQVVQDYTNKYGAIEHILVSGDIANKGKKEEYADALSFFKELCKSAGCLEEEIYVVPGNHDKNFNAPNSSIRHIIHAGLGNESVNTDKLYYELLTHDFSHAQLLYQPFEEYHKFAFNIDSVDPLMTKCLDGDKDVLFNHAEDKAYMRKELTSIGNYKTILYAMNTALNSDWYDFNDSEKGHKLFLPQLCYNAETEEEGCINIAMMHHPISYLAKGEEISRTLDAKFPIQIFGHIHKPVSDNTVSIHIHSGALQPHQEGIDKDDAYFSVFNILELDVVHENENDILSVMLHVIQYDKRTKAFKKMKDESKQFSIKLKKHNNLWDEQQVEDSKSIKKELPEGVTIRKVRFSFLQHPNPKAIINELSTYVESKSYTENCVDFLKKMEEEGKMHELWNRLNAK